MSVIARVLWVIESRLEGDLTLPAIAESVGLSRFTLSHIFPLTTGHSLSAYIRGRRLTEAARQLAQGAPDILSVALQSGYGSHEAFTRAFRDQFGVTPESVRQGRSLASLKLMEPIKMPASPATPLAPPRIERHPPFRLAGLIRRHRMDNPGAIPNQWLALQPYMGNLDGQIGKAGYGVVTGFSDSEFDYVTALEISPTAEVPKELQAFEIPEQTFARFAHKGHVTAIRSTIGAAYGDWLPQSGHETGPETSFIEYYGPDFDARIGEGTIEIWIGLKC